MALDTAESERVRIPLDRGGYIEVVPGGKGFVPYLWIGDADENYIASVGPEGLRKLRDALTRELRRV